MKKEITYYVEKVYNRDANSNNKEQYKFYKVNTKNPLMIEEEKDLIGFRFYDVDEKGNKTNYSGMYYFGERITIKELILIDIDKEKTKGEEMDLSHGLPFAPQKMVIKSGDYKDCRDAEIVVITAGVAQKPSQTRLELAEVNTKIVKSITQNIMKSGLK